MLDQTGAEASASASDDVRPDEEEGAATHVLAAIAAASTATAALADVVRFLEGWA